MTYIKPPDSHECTWRSGPPPEVGWWPASTSQNPELLRWWNGKFWSDYAVDGDVSRFAAICAKEPAYSDGIKWTDRWWLK